MREISSSTYLLSSSCYVSDMKFGWILRRMHRSKLIILVVDDAYYFDLGRVDLAWWAFGVLKRGCLGIAWAQSLSILTNQ